MQDNQNDRLAVYEIGYLIASSIPEEKIASEVESIKKVISNAGASIISEEMPRMEDLAYTIRRKTVAGSYEKFDKAYFGWVKFEVGSDLVESIKKTIEGIPSIIRILLITTVRENTYLGKRSQSNAEKDFSSTEEDKSLESADVQEAAPATIEEIDKSIDNMVKEA